MKYKDIAGLIIVVSYVVLVCRPSVVFGQETPIPTPTPTDAATPTPTGTATPTPSITATPTLTPTPTGIGCTDQAPGSTVKLLTAVSSGAHSITLTWTGASNPVTYYLLSYGLASGKYIYGNPNVGPQGTTSYTVGGLATGTKYYFVILAGNGCKSGSYSNELSAVAGAAPTAVPTVVDSTTIATTITPNDQIPTVIPTDASAPMPTPTVAPTSGGPSTVEKLVFGGTIVGVLLLVGVGVWNVISRRKHTQPPMIHLD